MRATRYRRIDPATILVWDGTRLVGDATARSVVVAVPMRFVSCRIETLPPALEPALKSAARLRAERAFAALGPVVIDAILSAPSQGRCRAVLLALPKHTVEAIRQAALAQGRSLSAIKVAELLVDVPTGGLVQHGHDATLIVLQNGEINGIAALGPQDDQHFATTLTRDRLRLNCDEHMPGGPALGTGIDFLHPTLSAPPALLRRPAVRLAALVAGVVLVITAAIGLHLSDVLSARANAQAEAKQLRPLAETLAERRADMAEVAPWLDKRESLSVMMHALSAALPPGDSKEQVRLVRVRMSITEDTIIEASANDRASMLAFIERLRRDGRVEFAEVRSSRSPSKEAKTVVFEVIVRLGEQLTRRQVPHATT